MDESIYTVFLYSIPIISIISIIEYIIFDCKCIKNTYLSILNNTNENINIFVLICISYLSVIFLIYMYIDIEIISYIIIFIYNINIVWIISYARNYKHN